MKLLLDGDILTYRIGFTTEDITEYFVRPRIMLVVDSIINKLKTDDFKIYLTSANKNSFRHKIYPEYKANRKAEKPVWYDLIRSTILETLPSELAIDCEADDLMGLNQTATTIIGSTDKDLDMIPGFHYNFVKNEGYFISEDEALHNFYVQLLTGDATDNIPGLNKIGPVKANEALEGCKTEEQYYAVCKHMYAQQNKTEDEMIRNGRLLWIWRKQQDIWRTQNT